MNILAVESSATAASAAVWADGALRAESFACTRLTHSQTLLPMIADMLRSARLTLDDVDAFAVAAGPGSFTGVRIGVSAVKGLAFGRRKPCVAVSTLEAMAYYSVDTLTTAYYDNALKSRYIRDEESGEMLDILFATRVYDLGFIFNFGGSGDIINNMYKKKQTDIVSQWESIRVKAETALADTMQTFAALQ